MKKNNKPKILFVAPLPPPVHGSAMVSLQIKESEEINVEYDCDFVNMSTSRRMDEIGSRNPIKIFRLLSSLLKALWLLLTHRYNLCYLAITCHGSGFIKDAPFVLLCKLFGRKVVIHQHNKGMAAYVDKPIYKWLLPLVYKNAKVILLSWHLYSDIEKVVKKESVLTCANGIKLSGVHQSEKTNDVLHILFLSNLLIEKGVIVLLDALKVLKERNCQFVCDFVGCETSEINATSFNEMLEERNLLNDVKYHGRKYGKDKEAFYRNADIFVFPTYREAFGLVLLEAMEYSVPCIASDEGSIPTIVEDRKTGLVVPRKDADALADAIEKLMYNPELRISMGKAGRKKLKEQFTQEVFEKTMCECLKASMK